MKKPLDLELKKKIEDLILQGYFLNKISKILNVGIKVVNRHVDDEFRKLVKKNSDEESSRRCLEHNKRILTNEELIYIRDSIENKLSLAEIQRRLKCASNTIKNVLTDYELKRINENRSIKSRIAKYNEKIINYKNLNDKFWNSIVEFTNNGIHKQEIIRKLNFKSQTLFDGFLEWKDDKEIIEKLKENRKINGPKIFRNNLSKVKKREKSIPSIEAINFFISNKEHTHKEKMFKLFRENKFNICWIDDLIKEYGPLKVYDGKGENNHQFGKMPSKKAGIGSKGWIFINDRKFFYRSSLELRIFLSFEQDKKQFVECRHVIKYLDKEGKKRNYHPDIVYNEKIFEIKPGNMIKYNALKLQGLKEYCEKFNLEYGILTEKDITIQLTDELIKEMIDEGKLIPMSDKDLEKLYKYTNKSIYKVK